ncbi:DNA polymerase III subunit delta' [Amylibacter sp. SFDW26]|uniref:DNA polymerase III subunit delta' n=1 Tax=Amylibacter sp. SFDW26 TaxID=2652722 RepID=UPI00126148A5|nr:DNA polymerase III subunit delta' [Amylibacter sp. SFDW26]KAB7615559.1 DNA polymerase III subunit delta' [Amylibacter sp. SFDW26]
MTEDATPQSDCVENAPHPRETAVLLGQDKAQADFLTAFQSGRMHHAWLITGPRGVGKATLAWKIAKFLLAQPNDDGGMFADETPPADTLGIDPNHPVLRRLEALGEPRLFLCRRPWDDKTKKHKRDITVEETRALKGFFNLSAADGGWRVAIVDAADEMNSSAANALLKILEEPPEKTIILLVSHQPARLLPTIRSRCRELRCEKLSGADMAQALHNAEFEVGQNPEALAELADGSVGEAIRITSEDGLKRYADLVSLTAQSPQMDRQTALRLANACVGKGNEPTYDLSLRLIRQMLSRIARFAALQPSTVQEAAQGEASMLAKLGPNVQAARKWADLSAELTARSNHARAVNLDPSSVILDMLLKINETARS